MMVEVVYGSPCSGKSTYVSGKLGDSDAVYDYDRILSAITNRTAHVTDKHAAHGLVLDFRETMLAHLHTASDISTAFIITRWPSDHLQKSLEGLDTRYTLMPATKDECYTRLAADDTRPDKENWRAVIDGWFSLHAGQPPVGTNKLKKEDLPMKRFWNWVQNGDASRTLYLDGVIAEESWYDDDVTPKMFKDELGRGGGDITVYINSPGGDCVAASQIYTMLMEYPHDVTVKIDGLAASAASVIAMAGTRVLMSPTSLMMIHNPMSVAMGDTAEMRKAIEMLDAVKESIINAYEIRTGMARDKLSALMDADTWLPANKALALGFIDEIMTRQPSGEAYPENVAPEQVLGHIASFNASRFVVTNNLLNKLTAKAPPPSEKRGTPIATLDKRLAILL